MQPTLTHPRVTRIDLDDEVGRFARATAAHESSACPNGTCEEMLAAREALRADPLTPITLCGVDPKVTRSILRPHVERDGHQRPLAIVAADPTADHLLAAAVGLGLKQVAIVWSNAAMLQTQLARAPRRFRGR